MNNPAFNKSIWMLAISLSAAAGCSPGGTDAGLAAGNGTSQSTRGTASQVPGEKGRTWEEALAHASAVEHEALTTENRAYRGLLDDRGAVGRAQMDAWGYPSPEELLRTFQESDESLKRRADAGDVRAQLLYADRLALRLEQSWAGHGNAGNHTMLAAGVAGAAAGLALRTSHNPFSVMVYGRTQAGVTTRPEAIAAALMVTQDMGDTRAGMALEEFLKKNPGIDERMTAKMIDDMNRTALM